MSAHFDAWLARRAARGDEAAFERLIESHARKLRNVVQSFAQVTDADADDLAQAVAEKLWTEIQRGRYNPHRAPFAAFASTVAHQACAEDRQRRRAQKRWAPEPPASLDVDRAGGLDAWIAPSWHHNADPLAAVLQRERLRLAWAELSDANQAALNRWLAADGGNRPAGLTRSETTCAARARSLAAHTLDALA